MLITGGTLMCLFIRYKWKINNMNEELEVGFTGYGQSWIKSYLNFTILWVCPIVLGILSLLVITDKYFGLEWLFGA